MNKPRSAYVHIPFCRRRCFYCDFPIVPIGGHENEKNLKVIDAINSYLEFLHREISLIPKGISPLSTIYIGGGTPSILSPLQIQNILKTLRKRFGIQDGCEISLEVDPTGINKQLVEEFIKIGINRFSLGGQSFDDKTLKKIGRIHNREQLLDSCNWLEDCFKKGLIESWNLDLIQNLPDENIKSWEQQLTFAIGQSPPHLSIYDLTIELGTVFSRKNLKGELQLPNYDLEVEINQLTRSILKKAGYSRYEISNYALPGHASRHNRVYWSGSSWWGFGLGATSAPYGRRLSRPKTIQGYKRWVQEQELKGIEGTSQMNNHSIMDLDELIMVGLRRREGVDLDCLFRNWGWNVNQRKEYLIALVVRWEPFIAKGFLKKYGERFKLTDPKGMDISNQILVEMFLWWDSLPKSALNVPIL